MRRIVLIGHPYSSIGVAAHLRSYLKGLASLSADVRVYDLFKFERRGDAAHHRLVGPYETDTIGPDDLRLFVINADEVEGAERALQQAGFEWNRELSVIVPAWELSIFPQQWVPHLDRFRTILGISWFVASSIGRATGRPIPIVGQGAERDIGYLLPRRYFGIRESAYVFLIFFDTSSYAQRKNSTAGLEALKRLRAQLPYDDFSLVFKIKGDHEDAEALRYQDYVRQIGGTMISNVLNETEVTSLLFGSDCLISLHRSEGFGRGPAEMMFMGRNVIATGYSGNMDYMSQKNSCVVEFSMVDVKENEYPFGEGQTWADADIDHAAFFARRLLQDATFAASTKGRGQLDLRRGWSDKSVAVRLLTALDDMLTA